MCSAHENPSPRSRRECDPRCTSDAPLHDPTGSAARRGTRRPGHRRERARPRRRHAVRRAEVDVGSGQRDREGRVAKQRPAGGPLPVDGRLSRGPRRPPTLRRDRRQILVGRSPPAGPRSRPAVGERRMGDERRPRRRCPPHRRRDQDSSHQLALPRSRRSRLVHNQSDLVSEAGRWIEKPREQKPATVTSSEPPRRRCTAPRSRKGRSCEDARRSPTAGGARSC